MILLALVPAPLSFGPGLFPGLLQPVQPPAQALGEVPLPAPVLPRVGQDIQRVMSRIRQSALPQMPATSDYETSLIRTRFPTDDS